MFLFPVFCPVDLNPLFYYITAFKEKQPPEIESDHKTRGSGYSENERTGRK